MPSSTSTLAIGKIIGVAYAEYLLPIIFTLALVTFVWGLFQYKIRAHDEEAKEEGKALMFYGLLAFLIMVAIWGLVRIATEAVQSSVAG